MKNRKKRNVSTQSFQHVYKISVDGGVVFYRTVDHLVYYTIESVMSMRYRIPVVAHSAVRQSGRTRTGNRPCSIF